MPAAPAIATIGTAFGSEFITHKMAAAGTAVSAMTEDADVINKVAAFHVSGGKYRTRMRKDCLNRDMWDEWDFWDIDLTGVVCGLHGIEPVGGVISSVRSIFHLRI